MGNLDNQPSSWGTGENRSPEEVLNTVLQDLQRFHQQMKEQVAQDIERLQSDKARLIDDIQQLQAERGRLQSDQFPTLSDPSSSNPAWLKQLTQIVAHNVERALITRINQIKEATDPPLLASDPGGLIPVSDVEHEELSSRELEAVLETGLNQTFQGLQEELSNYQSNLTQRLNRMQTLEQQIEVLLETVVNRLQKQLEPSSVPTPPALPEPTRSPNQQSLVTTPKPAPAPGGVQFGLFLALLSAVSLSLFNVCLKILLKGPAPREIFGLFSLEGIIAPGLGNSLLILLLRMIVVMALMPILASFLYPPVWSDLRRFVESGDRRLMTTVIGSGFFLFLSQVAIYIAIGEIPTGIAITIFFIYPIVTVLASWGLFGDKPTIIRIGAMITILGGGVLSLPNFFKGAQGNLQLGVIAAVCAGIAFAGYVLLTQIAAGKLHPVPFSLVNFASIFVFSAVSLMVLPDNLGIRIDQGIWQGLIIGGLVLGVLTLSSYLLNNFAIRSAGAALASIIGTAGPALTALFAFWIIGEALTLKQVFGMVLVILGVGAMSVERMVAAKRKSA